MKILLILFGMFGLTNLFSIGKNIPTSFYEIQIKKLSGEILNLSEFKGKKILLVNVASKCGFTPQYAELEKLQQQFKDKLVVIGVPSNNFLWQEPGTAADIAKFCKTNYNVSFPITEKVSVKGFSKHPLYEWLTNVKYNKFSSNSVKWNFQKYLIDENGHLIAVFSPSTSPLDKSILDAI